MLAGSSMMLFGALVVLLFFSMLEGSFEWGKYLIVGAVCVGSFCLALLLAGF